MCAVKLLCLNRIIVPGTTASTNDKQWEMAKKYFRANINCGEVLSGDDINNYIKNFNEIAYNYFAENHGKVDNITDIKKELIQKYKDFSKQQLKSELKKQKKIEMQHLHLFNMFLNYYAVK